MLVTLVHHEAGKRLFELHKVRTPHGESLGLPSQDLWRWLTPDQCYTDVTCIERDVPIISTAYGYIATIMRA